ncbi:Pentatricopeptide repeat-containing protein At5g16640 [Durusdinium trenchii]
MLSDMERNGVPPDTITYNAAIMALSLNKRWKEAVELIAEMWAAKIFPDVISYTSAISACPLAPSLPA